MSANLFRKYLFIGILVSFACCLPSRTFVASQNPDDVSFLRKLTKDQLLVMCIELHRRDSLPMQEYGAGLIADLIRLYERDPRQTPELLKAMRYPHSEIYETLIEATKLFAGYEEAKAGKAFVYRMVDSADEEGQRRAMYAIIEFDGEGATDVLLAKLRYPVESARITAASLLGDHGRTSCVADLQRILEERTREIDEAQGGKDYSLAFIQTAIEKLKDRANGIEGPSVSDRMSTKDLIERGPPVTNFPNASHAETPAIPHKLATDRAETQTLTDVAVISDNASVTSSAFLWTGGAVAIALLVILLVFWKRHV
jgi:hypothetical protein